PRRTADDAQVSSMGVLAAQPGLRGGTEADAAEEVGSDARPARGAWCRGAKGKAASECGRKAKAVESQRGVKWRRGGAFARMPSRIEREPQTVPLSAEAITRRLWV